MTQTVQVEKENKISVIVPVYNVISFLQECVDSVLSQTYKNLEIVLVDDGSTDGSGELCDRLRERDERIVVIHQENGGLSSARNTALQTANGELIFFLDSDDILLPQSLHLMEKALREQKADIVQSLCARCEITSENVKQWEGKAGMLNPECEKNSDTEPYGQGASVFSGPEFLATDLYEEMACAKLYRRECFFPQNKEPFLYKEGIIHEDYALTYKIVYFAGGVVHLPLVLYLARVREGSITSVGFREKSLVLVELTEERIAFFKEQKEELLLQRAYKNYYGYLLDFAASLRERNMLPEKRKELIRKYRQNFGSFWKLKIIPMGVKLRLLLCFFYPMVWRY